MLLFISYLFLAECERKKFKGMLEGQKEIVYTISRATLFNDVLSLYKKDKGLQYSFRFCFKDERAVDIGGITKDAFSAFF